jgi:hypothetical protein
MKLIYINDDFICLGGNKNIGDNIEMAHRISEKTNSDIFIGHDTDLLARDSDSENENIEKNTVNDPFSDNRELSDGDSMQNTLLDDSNVEDSTVENELLEKDTVRTPKVIKKIDIPEDSNNYESLLDISPRSGIGGNIVDIIVGGRARVLKNTKSPLSARSNRSTKSNKSTKSNRSNRSIRSNKSSRSTKSNKSIKSTRSNKSNRSTSSKTIGGVKSKINKSTISSSDDSDSDISEDENSVSDSENAGSDSDMSESDTDSSSSESSSDGESDNDSSSDSSSDDGSDTSSVAGGEDNNPYLSEEDEEEMAGGAKNKHYSDGSASDNVINEIIKDNECRIDKEDKTACGIFEIPEYSKKIIEYASQEFNKSFDNVEKAYHAIRKKLKCGSSVSCVIEDMMTKHDILRIAEKYFKPVGPAKSTEWLSNHNIDNLLKQLEEAYKGKYKHIPFQMIDFDEMSNSELRNLDIMKYYNEGYKGIGCVINTDVSSGSGIHWFCIYISLDQKNKHITLEYFNSSGQSPLKSINQWLHLQQKKLSDGGNVRAEIINVLDNEQIQKDSHSCGVWSITYILLRVRGMPPNTFKKIGAKDDLMIEMRKRLFIDKQ